MTRTQKIGYLQAASMVLIILYFALKSLQLLPEWGSRVFIVLILPVIIGRAYLTYKENGSKGALIFTSIVALGVLLAYFYYS